MCRIALFATSLVLIDGSLDRARTAAETIFMSRSASTAQYFSPLTLIFISFRWLPLTANNKTCPRHPLSNEPTELADIAARSIPHHPTV
jgi:hypothetical protein